MVEYTRPATRKLLSHAEREKLIEEARNKNILDVAQSLGMSLERIGRQYQWKEHDSLKISPEKNKFYWFSKGFGGGVINLVQTVNECSLKEAIQFLTGNEFATFTPSETTNQEFHYRLKEHKTPNAMRHFLGDGERLLSQETIDFFIKQGVLAQASYKDHGQDHYEPVVVFKNISLAGEIKGMALQGMKDHFDLYPRGKLKKTFGDGSYGCVVKVGNPPSPAEMSPEHPIEIIPFEATIDMMSYYEFFKDVIGDAFLVAMHGRKKSVISVLLADILGSTAKAEAKANMLDVIEKSTGGLDAVKIIMAVDNDEAGRDFVENFGITKIPVITHLPKLAEGETKSDWNELLQRSKKPHNAFEERLNQAKQERPSFASRLHQAINEAKMRKK